MILGVPNEASIGELACQKAAENEPVNNLQAYLATLPQVEPKLEHHFLRDENGKIFLYIRKMTKPAGVLVISKIHRTSHAFRILKGSQSHWDEVQKKWVRHSAGHVSITLPGTRRITFSHEETVIVTEHPTDTDDLRKIEGQVIFPHDVSPYSPPTEIPQ